MGNVVVRNQTPHHLELHGGAHVLKLAPLQRRLLGEQPRVLFGQAAVDARRDQVVDWEAAPTRSTVLRVASVCAATGLAAFAVAAVLLLLEPGLVLPALVLGVLALGAAALAVSKGRQEARQRFENSTDRDESEPEHRQWDLTDLLRDLVVRVLSYSAFLLLVVVGISAPATALWYGTDLSEVLLLQESGIEVVEGEAAREILVVRSLQLVLVVLVSMVPALMYFQFDREKLTTMVDRWLHVIFRLDPGVRTVADVDARYGRRVEEYLGASLDLNGARPDRRLRDRSPVVLCTLLIAIGWIVVLLSVPGARPPLPRPTVPQMFEPELTPLTMAFLGAYFLAVQVALRGFVRGDLKPKTYNVITVRILMAVLLAWALQALFGDGTAVLAAAFLAGVVPSTVLLAVRAAPGRLFDELLVDDDELDARCPLTQLDEIDVYERTRLEEEGITSVQALARHDLVDLMLSSRIPAPRLVDWVDQALLRQHVTAAQMQALREAGVRTASDLLRACADPSTRALLEERLAGGDPPAVPVLLAALLSQDEWAAQIVHWRQAPDPSGTTLVYRGDGGATRQRGRSAPTEPPRRRRRTRAAAPRATGPVRRR